MALTSQTKTLLTVAVILVLIYFFYSRYDSPIKNTGKVENGDNLLPLNMEEEAEELSGLQESEEGDGEGEGEEASMEEEEEARASMPSCPSSSMGTNAPIPPEDMIKYFPKKDYSPPESEWLKQKFNSRNKARSGYKRASYSGANRGSLGPSDWDAYFDHNNNVIGNSQTGENDKFLPIDESNGGFAVFKSKGRATCGSNQNCEPEDLFDVDKYLPQEVNDDWFEVQPEPISVKNRHLINITRPIGINTIGSSLRNSSYDLRGNPVNPKFVVSPFLNSSIEPSANIKPMF